MKRLLFLFLPVLVLVSSCNPTDGTDDDNPAVDFDRQEILAGWVDGFIIPRYADLEEALGFVRAATDEFIANPNQTNEDNLRQEVLLANLSYQAIDPLIIGKAEEIRLREQLNTYPTDTELIDQLAQTTDFNLDLPSNTTAQGFPALDYLLYGLEEGALVDGGSTTYYVDYLSQLVSRMQQLTAEAAADWTDENRAAFIANDGNSATASIDRTVNDFIFYYEKFLRAGKVGIPAGVFSDDPLSDRVEAPFSGNSKRYFFTALNNTKDFFILGGLAEYLNAMNVRRDGELLSEQIILQFIAAENQLRNIELNFEEQVETDNTKMLELYNELQRNVILMKVDMLQALSINVDYVDADGD